jgi:hypothetical protein
MNKDTLHGVDNLKKKHGNCHCCRCYLLTVTSKRALFFRSNAALFMYIQLEYVLGFAACFGSFALLRHLKCQTAMYVP